MKIIYNITNYLSYGGLQVAVSILRHWINSANIEIVLATVDGHGIIECVKDFSSDRLIVKTLPFRMSSLKTRRTMQKMMDRLVEKYQPDIVFTPFGPSYWTPKAPHLSGFALGQIVYPDSPIISKMTFKQHLKYFLEFQCYKKYFFKRNSHFFWCETEDVKQRMVRYMKLVSEQIVVAGNCCNQSFYDFTGEKTDDGFFNVLCPCSGNLHKNLEIIPHILERIKNLPIRFMVTLPETDYLRLFGKNNSRIINFGVLPPAKCPEVYAQCDLVFVPSLLECFTANYPEAMAMKKPIVTTSLSFARNLCGNAALYFDPLDAQEAAEKIIKVYQNANLRRLLTDEGTKELKKFPSPEQRADEIFRFMQYIIENN